ncbi:unnamed protein product, partial [Candidula unifasciata]
DMMTPCNYNSNGLQDYDVPPPDRDFINIRSSSRRPSYDPFRNSAGSRKASLVGELYDTPPNSKRTSEETSEGIYDTPPSSKRASSERTPPQSNRSSASRDSGSNLLSTNPTGQLNGTTLCNHHPTIVRQKNGPNPSENCYETPPGSNRSSLERLLSVENSPIYESLSPAVSAEHLDAAQHVYDVPPSRNHVHSLSNPNSQASLCSAVSNESLLSNTSCLSSNRISQNTSLPDSACSSMDLPSDIYDVPPSAQEGDRSRKQLSVDSGLGFYDSPQKSRPSSATSNTESLNVSKSSSDYKPFSFAKDIKRSKSLENTIDDLYDTPKNNGPKFIWKKAEDTTGKSSSKESSEVSSEPPEVARDSVISVTSDSSDDNTVLSSSLDTEQQLTDILLWDVLLLDPNSAVEMLAKKQQEISKATTKLSSYVNSTWRSRSSLEKTLYEIKVSCTLVKSSLQDFVGFCHGALANAVRLPDYHLASRLQKYVSPLQSTLELVNKSYLKLEDIKWQVSLLSEPLDKSKPDDLSQIALVATDLMSDVKKTALFIQSNNQILFSRIAKGEVRSSSVSSKPPVGLKVGNSGGNSSSSASGQYKNIQHRPLPAVPGGVTCIPPNSVQPTQEKPKLPLSEIKKTLNMDDYVECDDLSFKTETEAAHNASVGHTVKEHDYVHLDPADLCTSDSSNNELAWDGNNTCEQNEQDMFRNNHININIGQQNLKTDISEICNYDVNILPVNNNAFQYKLDIKYSQPEKAFPVLTNEETTLNSDTISDLERSEQDLKTPVNLNTSSDDAKFILPPVSSANFTTEPEALDPNDRQVLAFYIDKMNSHSTLLANAVDAFIGVVSNKEPPNVFISHSKFVMVSAHKLVHIGDSIHRNLINNSLSISIMQCANHLCDCLKASVTATKIAALQYPSPLAVQEMVDGVVAVSHAAQQLKRVIIQAAKQ